MVRKAGLEKRFEALFQACSLSGKIRATIIL
jgi:hypothetical protein